jgi:hypothetical protein
MSIAEDLTGRKFGRLTVKERTGKRHNYALWLCQCSCGKEVEVTSTRLRGGQQSCGCIRKGMKVRNLKSLKCIKGQRFGNLVVLEYVKADSWGKAVWRCQCDCGNQKDVTGSNLRQGITKGCGCLRGKSVRLGLGESARRRVLRSYQNHALERGLAWQLSYQEFCDITSQACYYCGMSPQNKSKTGDTYGDFVYNGVDRVDNTQGYLSGNVVPCCKTCNWMKNQFTKDEFLTHIQ